MDSNNQKFFLNEFRSCKTQSCSCNRCERIRKFQGLLDRLSTASKMLNYEEQIFATVAMICDVHIPFYSRLLDNRI